MQRMPWSDKRKQNQLSKTFKNFTYVYIWCTQYYWVIQMLIIVLNMSWGTVRDNLQKENSNDKYKLLTSGKGYFIRINISQRNCDPVWENHKSHHNIIYHSTDHVTEKKG